jgi:hypothetical protein
VSVATKVAGIYREAFNGQKSKGMTHLDSRARPHLKKMAHKKKRASQIAKTLKRIEGVTRQKALSLGISLDSRP